MNTQRKLIVAMSLCAIVAVPNIASAASISGQGTWETTLQGRDLNGDGIFDAYYDTTLNITWLANANAGAGSAFDDSYSTTDGRMTWASANAWAAALDVNGITGWRLPDTGPVDGVSYDYNFAYDGSTDRIYNVSAPGTAYAGSTGSEMAHLFYNTLGNLALYDTSGNEQLGWGLSNTGPFSNVQSEYWSATEYAPDTSDAWFFVTHGGEQTSEDKPVSLYAWAVHDGDVGASVVPVPAAAWLFGSGLLGLIGLARR